jgi:hypothetical protein
MDRQRFEEMQLERFRRAAACTLERERINTALRRRVWGAALLFVLGGAGVVGCLTRTTVPEARAERAEEDVPRMDAYVTDGLDAGAVAYPLPAKPFPGQKRPPCGRKQVAINGGCWRALEDRPDPKEGCTDSYQHGAKCYVEVREGRRPPVGIEP